MFENHTIKCWVVIDYDPQMGMIESTVITEPWHPRIEGFMQNALDDEQMMENLEVRPLNRYHAQFTVWLTVIQGRYGKWHVEIGCDPHQKYGCLDGSLQEQCDEWLKYHGKW